MDGNVRNEESPGCQALQPVNQRRAEKQETSRLQTVNHLTFQLQPLQQKRKMRQSQNLLPHFITISPFRQ